MGGPSGSPFFCAIRAGNPPPGFRSKRVRYCPNGRDFPQIGDCTFIPKFSIKRKALLQKSVKHNHASCVSCSPQGCVFRKNRIFNAETVFNLKAGGAFRWKERIFSGNIGAVLIFFMGGKGGVSGYNFPPRRIGAASCLIGYRKMARLSRQWRISEKTGRGKRNKRKGKRILTV